MNIAQRLALLLAVPLLVLAGLGVFIHLQLATIDDRGRDMADIQVPTLAIIGSVTRNYGELRVDARDYIFATDPDRRKELAVHFNATEAEMAQLFDRYARTLLVEEQDRQLLENYRRLVKEWAAGARVAMQQADRGLTAEGIAQMGGTMRAIADQLHHASEEWISHNERIAAEASTAMVATTAAARLRLWIAGGAALLVTAVLGLLTFRRIVAPIQSLEASVRTIAAGDYDKPVPHVDARDETGSLARSVEVLKQGAAQTHVQARQLEQQAGELRRINLLSDTALDLTKSGYWHMHLDKIEWYYCSEQAEQILGNRSSPDRRSAIKEWFECVQAGDAEAADAALENFEAAVAGRIPAYDAIFAYKRPVDGKVVWIHALGHITKDDSGKPKELFGVVQDVTEAKLAELAVKKGESALRQANFLGDMALELTKSGYWRVDYSDPDYYYQSERAAKIVGEKPKPDGRYHLQTEWFSRLVDADPDLAEQTSRIYRDALDGKTEGYNAIYPYKRPDDGRIVWVHAAGTLERGPDGKARYMYGVYQDITQAKQAERELGFRLSFQRALLDTIPYPMFFKDAAGRFAGCNLAYERELGTTAEFLNGKTVLDLDYLPEEARRKFHEEDMAVIREASRRSYELPIRLADGATHVTLYSVDGFRLADGAPGGLIGLLVDISEQKRIAEELRVARAKAEEATQMKSMFLANMSHEIRTPMNAIIGLSYLALKTPLNAKQRDYVGKVHNAGTSLLAVVNDILDFSKIEAGRLDLESISFKLDDVIGAVTTVTAQKAHEKGLEFLAQIAPGLPASLVGDPLRLGQVLTNLVNNAIKFTEQGEVRLTVELAERTGEKCQLRFSVRDTGMGMTADQAAKLFQPFTQADMSTTRKHGGTGLGLTISRRLVELMGGQIWFDSQPGVGTTFTFTTWVGIGSQSGSRRVIPEKLTKLRALIVDDNAAAREIVDGLLKDVVQHTDAVGSGPEAISAVQQQDLLAPYDVVFMDWRMPGIDGLEAARTIKGDPGLRHPPVIIMVTAFGREEVRDEAERLQLDGFLVKPVTKSMVVDSLINAFLDGDETAVSTSGSKSEGIALTGMRILLVEDNEINQQIAVELLEGVGASLTVANHGGEALDRLTGGPVPPPFDVVLMDLQMPVMDGHQATTRIRADSRFAGLPIIAMTAHATVEEREACVASGMNGHISKPIEPAVLFETLAALRRPVPAAAPFPVDGPARNQGGALPAVPGLNTADGLAHLAGNEKLYLKLLRQFAEQQAPVVDRISTAQAGGDGATAERLVHTLKGLAGSLGATSVQSAAGALEKLLHERTAGAEFTAALQQLTASLDPVIAGLRATLPPEAATAAVTVRDPVASRAAAARLARLLADFDAGATNFLEANQPLLHPLFGAAEWISFQAHIKAYAFSDALSLLQSAAPGLHP